MVVQGLGGIMSITGHPGMPLTRIGTSIGDLAGGLYTAIALNAALLASRAHRRGDQGRCRAVRLPAGAARKRDHALHDDGRDPRADGRAPSLDHPVRGVSRPRTAISSSPPAMTGCSSSWPQALGRAGSRREPAATRPTRCATSTRKRCGPRSRACSVPPAPTHWIEVLEAAGVPCGPVNNVAQALAHPQTAARNMLVEVDDPVDRPAEARRQSDEARRPSPIRRPALRPPTSTPTAPRSCANSGL